MKETVTLTKEQLKKVVVDFDCREYAMGVDEFLDGYNFDPKEDQPKQEDQMEMWKQVVSNISGNLDVTTNCFAVDMLTQLFTITRKQPV